MFSNSNAFLGGTTGRPGQAQYGQQSFQQPNGFGGQPTGFAGAPMQSQFTGYPAQQQQGIPQQQAQPTGFAMQAAPPFQQPQQQQQPLQSLQTGQQSMLQPAPVPPRQQPQPTGMTSSQMADSFRGPSAQPPPPKPSVPSGKIPNIRLSFITAQDQAKFEQLFKTAAGNEQALSGEKAKDLLLRSKLPGDALSHIWTLSDTTKSGQLLFPEFALAMYLCNLKIVGKDLPAALPEKIANEVSSMVDIISFGIPDNRPQAPSRSNAPSFEEPLRQNVASPPIIQQPQPQPSNSQLLSQLGPQPTGMQPSFSGFQGQLGFQPQQTGLQAQPTGIQTPPGVVGYSGVRPPLPPMPTGYGSGLLPNQTGLAPLNSQPTGRPGQWGLVNAPASGLPNIEALQQRMMPQPGREGGYTTTGLRGNATVPWAVTKDEKKIYDDLFKAWDGFNKGYISGDQAIEIFGQSGLEKSDLERIWTLSDPNNRGRLNLDEFAVAMHLIYRKLNGYPVPNRLPPELIPPSTRNLNDSIGTVKSMLSRDAEERKNSGAFLQPQRTGVSYLKNHSFRNTSSPLSSGRKDATVFKNNDDDVGYKSSARHRIGGGGRSPSPAQPASPASERSTDELSIEQLRKAIREKQVLLDAIDFRDENQADEDETLDRKDRRDAEDLYRRIRRVQEDIDSHPNAIFRTSDSEAERRALRRQIQALADRLPEIASKVRRTERGIADAKLELFRLRDAKAHPNAASAIIGTGPGGTVTESDRLKARARAMMQQRSAALTGKSSGVDADETAAAAKRLEEESSSIRRERENNERMVRDVEDSVSDYSKGLEDTLKREGEDSTTEHERRRWEDGLGVEDDVKEFIFDLQRSSRAARIRREETDRGGRDSKASSARFDDRRKQEMSKTPESPARSSTASPRPGAGDTGAGGSYSTYKTAEERAAFIKQQAEQRMAERLAALGLKAPSKSSETAEQRQERERKEREDRLRQAEEEDARREQERQRRLADEQVTPPSVSKSSSKKPPPPPSRKNKSDVSQAEAKRDEHEAKRAEQEREEQNIRQQQEAQEAERKRMEDEQRRQEEELEKEREAAQARLRALEEQVKQGKVKKEEEKRRKQQAQREAKEKEARLAAQRAELEAARERERQLQLQLESLGDDESSDEEGPQDIASQSSMVHTAGQDTPKEPASSQTSPPPASFGTSSSRQANPPIAVPSPPTAGTPTLTSPGPGSVPDTETKNPFLKKMAQTNDANAPTPASIPASGPASISSAAEVSTNPFHRLTQENNAKALAAASNDVGPSQSRSSRLRSDEDDWSVIDSDKDSSDEDEDDRPAGGNAKQLASILFGTMGPPRPVSAMDSKGSTPSSPAQVPGSPPGVPPPPPMPVSGAPPAPPPPPPPMPASGAPPPPPMPTSSGPPAPVPSAPGRGALLEQIQAGKGLKKVQTNDRSSAVAGQVLG